MNYFSIWDVFFVPLLVILAWVIAIKIEHKHVNNSAYRYYHWGLLYKIAGALALCGIYIFYYGGGDTTGYFNSAMAMRNLFFQDTGTYLSILSNNLSPENLSVFNNSTGYPGYYSDPNSFTVVRFTSVVLLFTTGSFLQASILTAIITYSGIWKLYLMFNELYPKNEKYFAIAVLFIPSVAFWGSGILKDSYTMAATGWLVYAFYKIFFKRERPIFHLLAIVISGYVLISIKAYILFALVGGILVWMLFHFMSRLKSVFFRILILPLLAVMFFGLGQYIIFSLGSYVGSYYSSMDALLEKAIVTQDDLTRDYYGTNSFDIGELDPSLGSIFSKAPKAIIAGLYRPFIFEANNSVMFISGIENSFLFFLLLWVIFKVGFARTISIMFDRPVILFCMAYSVLFAFSVGLTTANFGALVRYKIPLLPFYVAALYIIYHIGMEKKQENLTDTSLE
ncbi:MAG: hypothetical protein PF489_14865 [Salinivirgaceae bacterium]|jgi:hypothetical protein|nr:hypothetical protein [Salinivirgaceae bacterium]